MMEKALGAEVESLKVKMFEAKKFGVTEYQESIAYMSNLEKTVGVMLVKERIILQRLHQIEDVSILDKLDKESINSKGDGAMERCEEVT